MFSVRVLDLLFVLRAPEPSSQPGVILVAVGSAADVKLQSRV